MLKIIIKDFKGDLIQFTEQRLLYLRIGRLIVIFRLKNEVILRDLKGYIIDFGGFCLIFPRRGNHKNPPVHFKY